MLTAFEKVHVRLELELRLLAYNRAELYLRRLPVATPVHICPRLLLSFAAAAQTYPRGRSAYLAPFARRAVDIASRATAYELTKILGQT